MELEHRQVGSKLREDLLQRDEKIKHLQKQEILRQVDKDNKTEQTNQIYLLQERLTSM